MPRPKSPVPLVKQFIVKITEEDDRMIDGLVQLDAAEHREVPNRAAWFRRLVYREALQRRVVSVVPVALPSATPMPTSASQLPLDIPSSAPTKKTRRGEKRLLKDT